MPGHTEAESRSSTCESSPIAPDQANHRWFRGFNMLPDGQLDFRICIAPTDPAGIAFDGRSTVDLRGTARAGSDSLNVGGD